MRIAIDMRMYGPSFGLGRYNQKFLENLIRLEDANQYILLFNEMPEGLPLLPNNFQIKVTHCPWYGIREQFVLPFILYKLKVDLVHFTHFNVPIFYNRKFVVTIHDLIMTKFPSRRASTLPKFLFEFKYWFYDIVIRNAVKNSSRIIAVSKFTAQDVIKHFELSDEESKKISVIYEGVSTKSIQTMAEAELPEKFFLYVGNAYPHKNLELLVQTFKIWLDKNPDYYLILVGKSNYFYQRLQKYTADIMGAKRNRVIFPGFVADEKLISYYQKAQAYIFPSKYEGFGLPGLEAMDQGLPVLASQASSLPEIFGEAALYFDPENQNDLLEKMQKIITDFELRNKMIFLGKEQINKYSWERMAMEIVALYNQ